MPALTSHLLLPKTALTKHLLLLLGCRLLAIIEAQLRAGELPPFVAPSTAPDSRGHSGELPRPSSSCHEASTKLPRSCHEASPSASCSGTPWSTPLKGGSPSRDPPSRNPWADHLQGAGPPAALDSVQHGAYSSSSFWHNLAPVLSCLDQLLLHSHAVWNAGGTLGHGDLGVWNAGGTLGQGDLGGLIGALGPSGLAMGDELFTVCVASHTVGALHTVKALVSLCEALSTPLRVETEGLPGVGGLPGGGGMPGGTCSSTSPRAPLTVLTSEPAMLRMVLQWLIMSIRAVTSAVTSAVSITSIRAGARDGARVLDTAPLALPAQLLLKLCAPLALPHASASLMLAVLFALADQLPEETAMPLIHRLLHTPGPSGDLWAELLNLGPNTARGGGPGVRNSAAPLPSSAGAELGSLPPVPTPTLPGAHLGAPARVTPSAGFDALGFRVPSAVTSAVSSSEGFDALGFRVPSAVTSAVPSAVPSAWPAARLAPSSEWDAIDSRADHSQLTIHSEWDAVGSRAAAPVRADVGAALATPPSIHCEWSAVDVQLATAPSTPQRDLGTEPSAVEIPQRDLGTEPSSLVNAASSSVANTAPSSVANTAPSSLVNAASSSASMFVPRTPDRLQPPPSTPVQSSPSTSRRPTPPNLQPGTTPERNLQPGTTPERSLPPSATPSATPERGAARPREHTGTEGSGTSVPVPTLLLCNTPMQLRMLMQAEAVQRAHAEVRDATSTAARKWACALRTLIETKLDLVHELELEAQLLARASPLPITALPAPPRLVAPPATTRHDEGVTLDTALDGAATSLSARLHECERCAARGWRELLCMQVLTTAPLPPLPTGARRADGANSSEPSNTSAALGFGH